MRRFYVAVFVLFGLSTQLYGGSFENYKRSCGEGDIQGCYHLGVAYSKGDGVHKSLKNARRFLEFACDEGMAEACTLLQSLNKKVEAKNYKSENRQDSSTVNNKIKEYVLGIIKHGSAQFNYPMGTMPKGMVTGADAEYVAEYVSEKMRGEEPATFAVCAACHGTDGRGNGGLSADLLNLRGVDFEAKVDDKIVKYKNACDQGNGEACYKLGLLYEQGTVVEKQDAKANLFFQRACELKDISGCLTLATQYEVTHNMRKAVYYYDKICEENGGMCGYIAAFYEVGDYGLNKDLEKAKKYYKKDCIFGVKDSCKKVDEISYLLSSYQVESSTSQVSDQIGKSEILKKYTNECFGFVLRYPVDQFVTKILSDNADGITLYNRDRRLQLKAYGSWYGDNIRDIYRDELGWAKDAGQKVTYKVFKKNWFVLSGIDNKKQTIFYLKTYFRGGKSVSFRLEYPVRDKVKYNSLVSIVSKNFKIYGE